MEEPSEIPLNLCTRGHHPLEVMPIQQSTTWPYSPDYSHSDVSSLSEKSSPGVVYNQATLLPTTKCLRPFKAYAKDPIMLAHCTQLATSLGESYSEFRQKVLSRMHGGKARYSNTNMRRITINQQRMDKNEDPEYREKRRKNNEAAKRSRDNRRAQEDEVTIRCAYLEQENSLLRCQLLQKEEECARFRTLLMRQHT